MKHIMSDEEYQASIKIVKEHRLLKQYVESIALNCQYYANDKKFPCSINLINYSCDNCIMGPSELGITHHESDKLCILGKSIRLTKPIDDKKYG